MQNILPLDRLALAPRSPLVSGYPVSFWRFLAGESLGQLGFHFFHIALPWLVMELTGSTAQVATALLLTGAARMALTVPGGRLCERFSPRALVLAASAARALGLALLAALASRGLTSLPVLYAFCVWCGLTEAVFVPARAALLPRLVPEENLQRANSLLAAQEKGWTLVGPLLAGAVIAALNQSTPSLGTRFAFAANAAVLGLSLLLVRRLPSCAVRPSTTSTPTPSHSFRVLLQQVWSVPELRVPLFSVYAVNFLSAGPISIFVPVVAAARFSQGAQAIALLTSVSGLGALLGALLAGLILLTPGKSSTAAFVASGLLCAVSLAGLLLAAHIAAASAAVMILAALASFVNVAATSLLQRSAPPGQLGALMGLVSIR